jgi:hypothetical protein
LVDYWRIVVVTSGFGLWHGSRCIRAAKWSDVAMIRASKGDLDTPNAVCLTVQLADGSTLEMHRNVAGWIEFATAAHDRLPGMLAPKEWVAKVVAPSFAANEMILFERRRPY